LTSRGLVDRQRSFLLMVVYIYIREELEGLFLTHSPLTQKHANMCIDIEISTFSCVWKKVSKDRPKQGSLCSQEWMRVVCPACVVCVVFPACVVHVVCPACVVCVVIPACVVRVVCPACVVCVVFPACVVRVVFPACVVRVVCPACVVFVVFPACVVRVVCPACVVCPATSTCKARADHHTVFLSRFICRASATGSHTSHTPYPPNSCL